MSTTTVGAAALSRFDDSGAGEYYPGSFPLGRYPSRMHALRHLTELAGDRALAEATLQRCYRGPRNGIHRRRAAPASYRLGTSVLEALYTLAGRGGWEPPAPSHTKRFFAHRPGRWPVPRPARLLVCRRAVGVPEDQRGRR